MQFERTPWYGDFSENFDRARSRSDVQAVYTQITELDPGEDSWPFTDTVLVARTISTGDLAAAVRSSIPLTRAAPCIVMSNFNLSDGM